MNNLIYLIGAISFFIGGLQILKTKQYSFRYAQPLNLGVYANFIGMFVILISFAFFYIYFKNKIIKSTPTHTICPTCKQTYNFTDLKDGKCPKCNIDTVDIEKYYKDNPFKEDE